MSRVEEEQVSIADGDRMRRRGVMTAVFGGAIQRDRQNIQVAFPQVKATSHVQVTPGSNVGSLVRWVEVLPGTGFVLHFAIPALSNGTFTLRVVEAMAM